MTTLKLGLVGLLITALTGCASIAGDNTRMVKVDSYPAGAKIFVDNQQFGTTPAIITLPSYIYGGKSITLRKAGYQDHAMMVNSAFQPIALLDILAPVTFLIDGATGNLVKIDPAYRSLHANMNRA